MSTFRWSAITHDIALAKEVAQEKPEKPQDWEEIAAVLSIAFSTEERVVKLKGRGCRERMDRLLNRWQQENIMALKR